MPLRVTLGDLIHDCAARFAERPCITTAPSGETITHAELEPRVNRAAQRLLGAHIVGEGATELIHIGQAVINLGGGVDFFVENTFNYPTLAEAYKVAGLDAWNRMGQPEPGQ